MADSNPRSVPARFLTACLCLLGGVIALQLALHLLAEVWGWLMLIALVAVAAVAAWRLWRHYSGRW